MARLVAEEGLHLDVATGGELHVALRAGFPAERIVFHGNNKSDDELRAALDAGVGRIVVDSFDELDRLEALVGDGATAPRVLVRVTPGVEAHTHEYIETGTDDSKFGFGRRRTATRCDAAARVVEDATRCSFAGLPLPHRLADVPCSTRSRAAVDKMVGLVRDDRDATTGATVDELNLGGGLGVRYLADDDAAVDRGVRAPSLREAVAKALADARRAVAPDAHGRAGPLDRGARRASRSTASARSRTIPGVRTYVAVDGGMSDNPRPVTYGARYEAFLPARVAAPRPLVATVAGKHCEQGDLLVRDARLPGRRRGRRRARDARSPVRTATRWRRTTTRCRGRRSCSCATARARVVVRRETDDDLVRLDVDA